MNIKVYKISSESEIIKLLYKSYWTDTLSSNILELNSEYTKSLVDDMANKIGGFELKKKNSHYGNQEQQEIQQRKLDEITSINTQTSVNIQNELIKALVFSDD